MSTTPSRDVRLARLRTGFAAGGLEYLLTAGLSYLPRWLVVYRHHVLVRCASGRRGRRNPIGTTIRAATVDDARQLAGQGDITLAEVDRYLAQGDHCVVATEEGEIVATAWASRGTQYLVRLCLDFAVPDDGFYVHDTFTQPRARRRGLAGLCYRRLFQQLAEEGRTTAYAAIEVLNQGSRRAHARWGFRPVGRTLTLDVGPLRITYTPRWPVRTQRLRLRRRPASTRPFPPWAQASPRAPHPAVGGSGSVRGGSAGRRPGSPTRRRVD